MRKIRIGSNLTVFLLGMLNKITPALWEKYPGL
jgi:hypothetical protein